MKKLLTAAAVAKLSPGPTRRRIADGTRSLFLVIEPSGHKSWQMRFRRPNGKPAKLTLGPLDLSGQELAGEPQIGQPLSLSSARLLAQKVHRERALGHDVIADYRAAKSRQRAALVEHAANTFATAVRAYMDEYARPHSRKWNETGRMLGLDYGANANEPEVIRGGLVHHWADRPVASIDEHDIWGVIDEARRLGIPGLRVRNAGISEPRARMLFVALSSLFNWLRRQRRVDSNPCAGVPRPAPATVRARHLTSDEVRWFWQATDAVGEPFGTLLKLLLLTGQRLREVAGMRRDELSTDGTTWTLPGSRTKNGRSHVVPLAPLARELIASVQGMGELIFTTTGRAPVSGWSRVKRRLDESMLATASQEKAGAMLEPWRLHDLRRTAVTGMAELGTRPDVIELVVNHVSGSRSGVAGVYNKSELMPERKAALERWAAHIEGVAAGQSGKVVSLRSAS